VYKFEVNDTLPPLRVQGNCNSAPVIKTKIEPSCPEGPYVFFPPICSPFSRVQQEVPIRARIAAFTTVEPLADQCCSSRTFADFECYCSPSPGGTLPCPFSPPGKKDACHRR
jgi:hypothetical protein